MRLVLPVYSISCSLGFCISLLDIPFSRSLWGWHCFGLGGSEQMLASMYNYGDEDTRGSVIV